MKIAFARELISLSQLLVHPNEPIVHTGARMALGILL